MKESNEAETKFRDGNLMKYFIYAYADSTSDEKDYCVALQFYSSFV